LGFETLFFWQRNLDVDLLISDHFTPGVGNLYIPQATVAINTFVEGCRKN
jgi:hypothetical protein